MDIKDKVALVTGAGSGMGAETARALSKAGARVVLMDINKEAIQSLAATLNAYSVSCDITDSASVEAAFELINSEWGVPQILVNCAGIVYGRKVVSSKGVMSLEAFKKVIDVNVIGTFNTLRLAAFGMMNMPVFDETGERGVIINTASIAAFEGQIGQSAYSASKGAIVAMTLPLAREFAASGIRVMTIAPGLIDTPMMASLPAAAQLHLEKDRVFPRRLGKPEEFSNLVLHIIDNVLLNGETIRLDGAVRLSQ
jgi:NAD(P)-dependent dehydrogenase (short-subunit alcohol dehydrogenase family)